MKVLGYYIYTAALFLALCIYGQPRKPVPQSQEVSYPYVVRIVPSKGCEDGYSTKPTYKYSGDETFWDYSCVTPDGKPHVWALDLVKKHKGSFIRLSADGRQIHAAGVGGVFGRHSDRQRTD